MELEPEGKRISLPFCEGRSLMPSLECSTSAIGGLAVVTAVGDVDFASAEKLWESLVSQLTLSSAVVLDCTGISFMDSSGLRSLVRARQHAIEQQAAFGLVGLNVLVERVFDLTGLNDLLPRFGDIDAARAALTVQSVS
ncbi:anti-anti-sigma factor [Catenulispora sp. GP43]|uniref:STAS domain-containing protein n=1 Tax=Catenulispora sp. GP43 TaxID=3156263 RepID=UPI0035199F83